VQLCQYTCAVAAAGVCGEAFKSHFVSIYDMLVMALQSPEVWQWSDSEKLLVTSTVSAASTVSAELVTPVKLHPGDIGIFTPMQSSRHR